ncbi:hypothetical protein ACWDV4_20500 [Micromonospora sp. NPDC003197]
MSASPMGAVPPPPPPPPPSAYPTLMRRPPAVVAAALLMLPGAATWLAAGIGFLVAIARTEGDAKFLLWIIAFGILGVSLLLVLMTLHGIWAAWRGRSSLLTVPAGFTLALFVLALVNLLVQGRLNYTPTMLTPLIVGGLAGVALVLLKSRPARAWFAQGGR